MEPHLIYLALLTFFLAAFFKGTVGLGFSTSCLGIMASYLDLKVAIPLVIIPSLLSNIIVMVQAGGFIRTFRRFWLLTIAALPGLLLGLWILNGSDTDFPRGVLGVAMLLYGAWGLWGGTFHFKHTPPLAAGVGFLTGIVNGLTGSQIMPVVPYLMSLRITKDELVQAMNTSFTLSSLVLFMGLGKLGLLSTHVVALSAAGIIPVGLGVWIGGKVRRRIPETVFRKIVFVLIIILGLGLIYRACY